MNRMKSSHAPKAAKRAAPATSEPARKSGTGKEKSAPAARVSAERRDINAYLQKLKFKKSIYGVDEQDIWKKLTELNKLYEAELRAERLRYDTLLAETQREAETALNGIVAADEENLP